jgi:hypothetical protein
LRRLAALLLPTAETKVVEPLRLYLLGLSIAVKSEKRGDQHCNRHRRGEHDNQHGTILLRRTTSAPRYGFVDFPARRSRAVYDAAIEQPLIPSFSHCSAWRADVARLQIAFGRQAG